MDEKETGELISLFVSAMVGEILMDKVITEIFAEMSEDEWDDWDKIFSLHGTELDREQLIKYRKEHIEKTKL